MIRFVSAIGIVVFSASTQLSAATLIEISSKNSETTKIMTDGKKARMDMGADGSYMLIDYQNQSVYAVMPAQKQIMVLSSDSSTSKGAKRRSVVPPPAPEVTPSGQAAARRSFGRISVRQLARVCHNVGTALHAGVDIRRVWETESRRGSARQRREMTEIRDRLGSGSLTRARTLDRP